MALLVLIPLLGIVLFWRRATNSRSASAVLHTASAILAILYLGALGDVLQPVTVLLLICGALLACYESVNLIRQNLLMPVPLGVLLILSGLFVLLHHDAAYFLYDEYSHWGIFLNEMLAGNQLWGSDSNAMVLRYPPGAPLWQYFFLRFTVATEGNAYFAQFCLLLIPLLVLWQGVKWRQIFWLLAIFALVALALTNFGHGFASLYVDHVLGAWFAGTIFNFMRDLDNRSSKQLYSYLLPVSTLVLIKDSGLYFALAAVGIMSILVFWRTAFVIGEHRIRDGLIKAGALACAGIVCAGLITTSWNANRDATGIAQSTYSTGGIVSGITSGTSSLSEVDQIELGNRFRQVIFHQQISKNEAFTSYNEFTYQILPIFTDRFRLTTISLILLFALWQIVTLHRLVEAKDRWRWAIAGAGLILSAITYIGILFLSYRFAFSERGIILPSYMRYVHTALLPMVLFVFLPLLPAFARSGEKPFDLPNCRNLSRSAAIFTAVLGALYLFETPHLVPLYKKHEAPAIRQQFQAAIEDVRDLVVDARLWIYLPIPDANGMLGRIFLYEMTPVQTAVVTDLAFLTTDLSVMQHVINDWDYLWFPIRHPQYDEKLKFLFGEDLKDRVFRIDRSAGEIDVVALDHVFD